MPQESFATLLNRKLLIASSNSSYMAVEHHFLVLLLAPMLAEVYVHEAWYLDRYSDVADGISRGEFISAAEHYAKVGYFEHRMPYLIEVDEPWYLENYPDVATAVQKGTFASGEDHFLRQGFREGRFPHAHFNLLSLAARQAQLENAAS